MAKPYDGTITGATPDRPAAALTSHPFARTLIDQPGADAALYPAALCAAILLAEPEWI
ncbi:hypothetical protein [Methylobacterium sp. P1-11]|uniref:hypothetical protein n=1 Tax=Methylobacterium sp. P1-11 TaxID=2024616 RepID=UPI001566E8AE|nr:hypothetical protein [Methylobacterium sp. P1-11]